VPETCLMPIVVVPSRPRKSDVRKPEGAVARPRRRRFSAVGTAAMNSARCGLLLCRKLIYDPLPINLPIDKAATS
jgi:hypothetical protein